MLDILLKVLYVEGTAIWIQGTNIYFFYLELLRTDNDLMTVLTTLKIPIQITDIQVLNQTW